MRYPIGIQTFEDIRKDGYVYVDKTAHVYNMVSVGRYYFLSRPRRFGKSLLVSTLEAYFTGRKELFCGLEIFKRETEWKSYPVFHLDLSGNVYSSLSALDDMLNMAMDGWDAQFGVQSSGASPAIRLNDTIEKVYGKTGRQIVFLVDEYDKPLIDNITNPELAEGMRNNLKAFFSRLKSNDRHIRFGFLTGVTQFSHVSIFSDLNNLIDISMLPQYSDICGLNEEELAHYCNEDIKAIAEKTKCTMEEMYNKLKSRYDGYHFCPQAKGGI